MKKKKIICSYPDSALTEYRKEKLKMDFVSFPKIPRLNREIIVTEKIDGTNAQICITQDGEFLVGSRKRWITPTCDNHGFAAWAYENKDELMKLGIGHHYGEWFGAGIQRNYGLTEKRLALFNTSVWNEENIPNCCSVVPILYRGVFNKIAIDDCVQYLRTNGSVAVPGYMNPEGIVIFHTAAGHYFKVTLEHDEMPKELVGSEYV